MASLFILSLRYKAYIKRAAVYYKYVPPYRAGYYKLSSIGNLNKTIKYVGTSYFFHFFFFFDSNTQSKIDNKPIKTTRRNARISWCELKCGKSNYRIYTGNNDSTIIYWWVTCCGVHPSFLFLESIKYRMYIGGIERDLPHPL
jgi:hypothetical protein